MPSLQTFLGTVLLILRETFYEQNDIPVWEPGNTASKTGSWKLGQEHLCTLVWEHLCKTVQEHHCTLGRPPVSPWSWSPLCIHRRDCSCMFQEWAPRPCCSRAPPIGTRSPPCTGWSTRSRCTARTPSCTGPHTRSCRRLYTSSHKWCCTLVWWWADTASRSQSCRRCHAQSHTPGSPSPGTWCPRWWCTPSCTVRWSVWLVDLQEAEHRCHRVMEQSWPDQLW